MFVEEAPPIGNCLVVNENNAIVGRVHGSPNVSQSIPIELTDQRLSPPPNEGTAGIQPCLHPLLAVLSEMRLVAAVAAHLRVSFESARLDAQGSQHLIDN